MSVEAKWRNRKSVVGMNEIDLAKLVAQHEVRGWCKVGKGAEVHGVYRS